MLHGLGLAGDGDVPEGPAPKDDDELLGPARSDPRRKPAPAPKEDLPGRAAPRAEEEDADDDDGPAAEGAAAATTGLLPAAVEEEAGALPDAPEEDDDAAATAAFAGCFPAAGAGTAAVELDAAALVALFG